MASLPTDVSGQCDCGKPARARGFCVACYYRQLRSGQIVAGTPTNKRRHRLSEINAETRTAICTDCGPVKIRSRGKNGSFRCATDANARSKLYKKAYRRSRKIMLNGNCELCGTTERLVWDHSHKTGKFRGTLCGTCNSGLGMLRDDPDLLRKAAAYVEHHDRLQQTDILSD